VTEAPCGTREPIPDHHRLWRSAKDHPDWHTWDADRQSWLPDGYTLWFNTEWSVSWAEHLERVHELTPVAATGAEHPLVYEAAVEAARGLGMPVTHTPQGPTPVDCAHTSVAYVEGATPPKDRRNWLRTELARRLVRVHGAVTLQPPVGA
jgi:hypothetical protein